VRLSFRAYVGGDEPPRGLVGSVRAIIFRGAEVVVIGDGTSVGLVAGGRPDPGEPLDVALVREVLEETGWWVRRGPVIGVVHARRLDPELPLPPGWNRPDPEFLDPIYVAEALTHEPGAMHAGEQPARFVPVAEARAMVGHLLRTFLDRAISLRDT
jgi:8-oxo-dGTP pyrophosphatase MutT (NUDIX family)